MKRFPAAVLCAAFCFLVGCGRTQAPVINTAPQPAASGTAQAAKVPAVATLADTFNPYRSNTTLTLQNTGLLFEFLVCIDPSMQPEYRLAEAVLCSGTTVTVRLRSGCTFADGTPITAQDAAASLLAAKASASYGGRFANVSDVTVGEGCLTITLTQPDCLFAYLLDIPVMKSDEVTATRPTASGRYTYGESDTLVKNALAPFPCAGPDTLQLAAVSNYDAMVSGMSMGEIDLYLTPDDAAAADGISSQLVQFKTNELLFLGMNTYADNPLCNTAAGRSLLSALTDRHEIAEECYYSRAYPATGLINGFYPCVRQLHTIAPQADNSPLEQTMAQLGYTRTAGVGPFTDADGHKAEVQLLVYAGSSTKRYTATLLQQQWTKQGISVAIEEAETFEDYLEKVQSGKFELYIGEMKLYNNMEMVCLWQGSAGAWSSPGDQLLAAYQAFRADAAQAGQLEAAFAAQMPFIPLLWKNGSVTAGRAAAGVQPSVSDAFYSLDALGNIN